MSSGLDILFIAILVVALGYATCLAAIALVAGRNVFVDWFFPKNVKPPRFGLRAMLVGVLASACLFGVFRRFNPIREPPPEEWTAVSSLGTWDTCDCGRGVIDFSANPVERTK